MADYGHLGTWIYKNGYNFVTGLPIDVMFGSRVGFPAVLSLDFYVGFHIRNDVARNTCVSWAS